MRLSIRRRMWCLYLSNKAFKFHKNNFDKRRRRQKESTPLPFWMLRSFFTDHTHHPIHRLQTINLIVLRAAINNVNTFEILLVMTKWDWKGAHRAKIIVICEVWSEKMLLYGAKVKYWHTKTYLQCKQSLFWAFVYKTISLQLKMRKLPNKIQGWHFFVTVRRHMREGVSFLFEIVLLSRRAWKHPAVFCFFSC